MNPALGILMLMLISPAWMDAGAADFSATPWKQGDEAFAIDGTWGKQRHDDTFDVRGTWFHYVNDRHRVGANVLYFDEAGGEDSVFGVGPSYEYLFSRLGKGRAFVGGDANAVGEDLSAVDAITAAVRVGYELDLWPAASLRFQLRWQTTVDDDDDALASDLDQYGFSFGIAFGAPK